MVMLSLLVEHDDNTAYRDVARAITGADCLHGPCDRDGGPCRADRTRLRLLHRPRHGIKHLGPHCQRGVSGEKR